MDLPPTIVAWRHPCRIDGCSTALGAELLANDVAELLLADLIDALPRVEAAHLDHKSQALLQLL